MPNKVPPNFAEIMIHSQVHLSFYRQQFCFQESNISLIDDNGKLAPVQDISKWKVVIIRNYNWNAPVVYGITNPCGVHFITFNMKAEFTPLKPFFIRECGVPIKYVKLSIISPQIHQLLPDLRILDASSKVDKSMPATVGVHIKIANTAENIIHQSLQ